MGVVDLSTGTLLDSSSVDPRLDEHLAMATVELIAGENMSALRHTLGTPGRNAAHPERELVVTTDDRVYMFLRSVHRSDVVLVTAYRRLANIGKTLARARHALSSIDQALWVE
ncbi:MAG: hypothetical protein H6712_21735 [Myxococcales bacterium]|nr:hypothetical protein [Myxococcales bacterium]MCB9716498.1 hypothetical protein [Myxococcales bacterium]